MVYCQNLKLPQTAVYSSMHHWPFGLMYRKVPKFSDSIKFCCNLPKIQTKRPNLKVFHRRDASGITDSEDPDQTAPGSALFARTYLSEKLGSLR